jgi:Flp pilus assembly CpaE family ATPase
MNNENINVLLIEDDPDYAELVEQWLSSTPSADCFCLQWTDTLAHGLNRLAEGNVDVILLDLGLPDSTGVPTFTALGEHAKDIPVIILSGGDSESLALRMIQDGAADYLVKSSCNADLLVRALRYAMVRHRAHSGKSVRGAASRVLGVIGAKGGVGVTTVACSLAEAICQQTGEKVLLADLDLQRGSVSFMLGVEPKYSVLDAVGNIDRLDASCWAGIVTQMGPNLSVLSSPALLGAQEPDATLVHGVLRAAIPIYRWVVVDLGPLNAYSLRLLDTVDEVLLVTTPAILGLYDAKRTIDALVHAGLEGDRVRLIINRGEESQSWSTREIHKMFGLEVSASIPNDSQSLHDALIARSLPGEGSKVRKEVARLAQRITGVTEPAPKRGLARFLPFGERSRKSEENTNAALTR